MTFPLTGPGIFLRRPQDLDVERLKKAGITWVAVALTYSDRPVKGAADAARRVKAADLGLVTWDWFPSLTSDPSASIRLSAELGAVAHWTNIEVTANGKPAEAKVYAERLKKARDDIAPSLSIGLCSFGLPPKRFPLASFRELDQGVAQIYDRTGAYVDPYPEHCFDRWGAVFPEVLPAIGAFVGTKWRTPEEIERHRETFPAGTFGAGRAWIAWPPIGVPSIKVLRAIARTSP